MYIIFRTQNPLSRTPAAPTCAEKQLQLLQDEAKLKKRWLKGATAWLADGLDIEQAQ